MYKINGHLVETDQYKILFMIFLENLHLLVSGAIVCIINNNSLGIIYSCKDLRV